MKNMTFIRKKMMDKFVLNIVCAILITAAFGYTLDPIFFQTDPLWGAIHMLTIAGSGWIVQLLLGRLWLKDWWAYWIKLSWIMVVGVLLLTPAIVGMFIGNWQHFLIPTVAVSMSFLTMLFLHQKAVHALPIATRWTGLWTTNLLWTALAWMLIWYNDFIFPQPL